MASDWTLELRGAWKRYGADGLFEDLDLRLVPAKAVRIAGPNGSGKTQLLLALSGLVALDRGELLLTEGGTQRILPPEPYARDPYVRFVPDRMGALASFPIGEVVLALCRALTPGGFRSRRRAAAERFATEQTRMAMIVGKPIDARLPADRLSIGQQKRLSIGAIGRLPKALLFDEPLSGLDADGIARVLQILSGIRRAGVAIVVAEHREEIDALGFDEVITMPHRRLSAAARPAAAWSGPTVSILASTDDFRLVLRNVTAGYPGSEVSTPELAIRCGEVARITGPNGVGKTGFLKALVGQPPARLHGHVEFDGRARSDLRNLLASGVVRFMSQDRRTFPGLTVTDVLRAAAMAVDDSLPEEIRELGRIAGARKRVEELSSGNRALIVLGQTLASRPLLALLDEPFANVDTENRRRMIDLISHARDHWGTAFISVEHGEHEAFEDVRYHMARDHDRTELQRVLSPSAPTS